MQKGREREEKVCRNFFPGTNKGSGTFPREPGRGTRTGRGWRKCQKKKTKDSAQAEMSKVNPEQKRGRGMQNGGKEMEKGGKGLNSLAHTPNQHSNATNQKEQDEGKGKEKQGEFDYLWGGVVDRDQDYAEKKPRRARFSSRQTKTRQ